jgi:hypothetical protein
MTDLPYVLPIGDDRRAWFIVAGWDELYAHIPPVPCKGLCHESCGPIGLTPAEQARLREAGVRIPDSAMRLKLGLPVAATCPALTPLKRCAAYEARPMICFLPSAWIYTSEGPKRIHEILAGDRVYGADGSLQRVLATASRYYEGTIVNVGHTGTHVPCWSTADHQWLTARQKDKRTPPIPVWRAADELIAKRHHQAGDYLCFPQVFEDVPDLDSVDASDYITGKTAGDRLLPFTGGSPVRGTVQAIPAQIPVDADFLFMLGLYLAEGSASYQSVSFTMHVDEAPILKDVARYLDSLGITSHTLRVLRCAALTVSSALLGRLMKALCEVGATEKRIHPRLFAQLSHSQLWSVYRAWDVGDGRKVFREREMSTTTTSERLAVQMSFVALANGVFPRTYVTHRSDRNGTSYDVHLFPSNWRDCKRGHGTKNMFDENLVYTPVAGVRGGSQYRRQGDASRFYQGPVIDIQVEEAESFVTSSGIAHNCRLWGAVESMPCPWGCQPEGGLLPDAEGRRLIQAAAELSRQQRERAEVGT